MRLRCLTLKKITFHFLNKICNLNQADITKLQSCIRHINHWLAITSLSWIRARQKYYFSLSHHKTAAAQNLICLSTYIRSGVSKLFNQQPPKWPPEIPTNPIMHIMLHTASDIHYQAYTNMNINTTQKSNSLGAILFYSNLQVQVIFIITNGKYFICMVLFQF